MLAIEQFSAERHVNHNELMVIIPEESNDNSQSHHTSSLSSIASGVS